jgi:hypothetical protein
MVNKERLVMPVLPDMTLNRKDILITLSDH